MITFPSSSCLDPVYSNAASFPYNSLWMSEMHTVPTRIHSIHVEDSQSRITGPIRATNIWEEAKNICSPSVTLNSGNYTALLVHWILPKKLWKVQLCLPFVQDADVYHSWIILRDFFCVMKTSNFAPIRVSWISHTTIHCG